MQNGIGMPCYFMESPLRIELFGGLYHVTSRRNRREDIYFSDADREAWLVLLDHMRLNQLIKLISCKLIKYGLH